MSKRDILSIALKILGVVSIMYTVIFIPTIWMAIGMLLFQTYPDNYQSYMYRWNFIISVINPVCIFIMGYILLKWGNKISVKLIRENKDVDIKVSENWDRHVFILSLRIIGVIWFVSGFLKLVTCMGKVIVGYVMPILIGDLLGGIVFLGFGIYLLFDGKHLIKLAFKKQARISVDQETEKT